MLGHIGLGHGAEKLEIGAVAAAVLRFASAAFYQAS
jgi:hypothetical protein